MSKKVYIVNCYTCQHNGQETCKGCNTLMNGDVEPYQNWELREDLEQKDQRIAELEQELAEMTRKYEFSCRPVGGLVDTAINLEKQLAELKEKAIVVPVKLGDTIYVVPSETNYRLNIVNGREEQNKVYGWIVSEIRYNKHGYSIVCDVGDAQFYCNYEPPKNLCGHFDTEKYYGETWFSTLEEAEKKLQELRGGE